MNFVDVFGPPGVGKSTLCDPLWHHRAITWDGKLPPAHWKGFLDEMMNLFLLTQAHPSFEAVIRMNNRSMQKMATVWRLPDEPYTCETGTYNNPFIHVGFIQRGLGFGWRLNQMGCDVNLIRQFFWLMPVSIGVAFLEADEETIVQRNHDRLKVQATSHENRDFMVPLMQEPIRIAREVLHERGVPVCEIDVQNQQPDESRKQLVEFATGGPSDTSPSRFGSEVEMVSPPPWWRG